jgi:hypothetical protein
MAWLGTKVCSFCATPAGNLADYFLQRRKEPEKRAPEERYQWPKISTFFALFSWRFSMAVLAGFFFAAFFASIPLDMTRTPLKGMWDQVYTYPGESVVL